MKGTSRVTMVWNKERYNHI